MPRIDKKTLRQTLPDVHSPRQVAGLTAPLQVYRDALGVPHVRAKTEHDAFFGQGWVQAQDRMWQMEYDRRRAYGTWSALIGAQGLPLDRQMRRFQIRRGLQADYDALTDGARRMLDAHAQGINAFLATRASPGVEFDLLQARPQPWQALDSLAVYKVRHIMMGLWESKLWQARLLAVLGAERTAALHPGYPSGGLLMVPPDARFSGAPLAGLPELSAGLAHLNVIQEGMAAGSNNWVVGGQKTASGLPLLAGDPHRALDVPNVYYPNHAACPTFDAVGFSFPGVPGFSHFGHNTQVAWCITHGGADNQDLYSERFDPTNPERYRWQEEWRRVETSLETIEVKDGAAEHLRLYATHHGPVVLGDPSRGSALAFCYSAMAAPNRTMDAVHAMLLAENADELEASQQNWVDPVNNMLYCDVHGAFGYRTRGELPQRSMANAWLPVPGWTGEHEWKAAVPFAEMPALRNPETGYAYSANNRIVGEDYPHYIALDFAPGFRAERIATLLAEGSAMTVADMSRIHTDIVSIPAQHFRDHYRRITPADEDCAQALRILSAWDGAITAGETAPLLFAAFRHRLLREVLQGVLGHSLATEALSDQGRGAGLFVRRIRARLHLALAEQDSPLLPPGRNWEELLSIALSGAVAHLRTLLSGALDSWRWDALHRTAGRHLLSPHFPELAPLLDPPAISMGGDGDTVQAADCDGSAGFVVTTLSVARYVFDPSDWRRSCWVIPGGVSGHPGSPHYADQLPTYAQGQMHPMLYDWQDIAEQAQTCQQLQPADSSESI